MRPALACVVWLSVSCAFPALAAAESTTATPSPQPLWNAYPLNPRPGAGTSQTPRGPRREQTTRTDGSSGVATAVVIAIAVVGGLGIVGGVALYWRRAREPRQPRDRATEPARRKDAQERRLLAADAVAAPRRVSPAPAAVPSLPVRARNGSDAEDVSRTADGAAPPQQPPAEATRRDVELLTQRGREVVADLLDILALRTPLASETLADDEDLVVALCERIRAATSAGEIEWRQLGEDAFIWDRAGGSLSVRTLDDGARQVYAVSVHDWTGSTLDTVSSSSRGAKPVVANVIEALHVAARESASRMYEPIDTMIDALRQRQ